MNRATSGLRRPAPWGFMKTYNSRRPNNNGPRFLLLDITGTRTKVNGNVCLISRHGTQTIDQRDGFEATLNG